jgi:hypothetical protein
VPVVISSVIAKLRSSATSAPVLNRRGISICRWHWGFSNSVVRAYLAPGGGCYLRLRGAVCMVAA